MLGLSSLWATKYDNVGFDWIMWVVKKMFGVNCRYILSHGKAMTVKHRTNSL